MTSVLDITDSELAELLTADKPNGVDPGKNKSDSQADRLIVLVQAQGIKLFHDQYKKAFARVNHAGFCQIIKCESDEFQQWMAGLFWREEHKAINSEALRSATNVLVAQAIFDSVEYPLHNRLALKDGVIWYDLTDEKWRAVRISRSGWEIVANPPILFRRYNHQVAQVEPVVGGGLRDLLRFINVANEAQGLLLLVVLVSYLIPDIPHPVLVVHGPQGSAKTSLLRIVRRLIDPSIIETLSLSNDKNEFIQQLSHHYAPAFDNVSQITEWMSDAFCRAVTGEGHSKRELYSDDDDIIYHFRRCISLNGINVPAQKPDLLNRSILIGLGIIEDDRRTTEEALHGDFEKVRPQLFGAMLDCLSQAMTVVDTIRLQGLPRMADFCRWGCAIAEVLDFGREAFLNAYEENSGLGHEEALGGSLVAHAVQCLLQREDRWEGTAQELYEKLDSIAVAEKTNTRSRDWPKAPNSLVRKLNEITPNLQAIGVSVETRHRTGTSRKITIQKVAANIVTSVTSSPSPAIALKNNGLPDRDDSDDISRTTVEREEATPREANDWKQEMRRRFAEIKSKRESKGEPGKVSRRI